MTPYLRENNSKDSGFLNRNQGSQKEVNECFPIAETEKLSIQNRKMDDKRRSLGTSGRKKEHSKQKYR